MTSARGSNTATRLAPAAMTAPPSANHLRQLIVDTASAQPSLRKCRPVAVHSRPIAVAMFSSTSNVAARIGSSSTSLRKLSARPTRQNGGHHHVHRKHQSPKP